MRYVTITSTVLMEILINCTNEEKALPIDWVEEFFLIADVKPPLSANEFVLPRSTFKYAFPLWVAAHFKQY